MKVHELTALIEDPTNQESLFEYTKKHHVSDLKGKLLVERYPTNSFYPLIMRIENVDEEGKNVNFNLVSYNRDLEVIKNKFTTECYQAFSMRDVFMNLVTNEEIISWFNKKSAAESL